jgi:hypothetical protein
MAVSTRERPRAGLSAMAATEPGAAPNPYTLGRLLKTWAKLLVATTIVVLLGLVAVIVLIYAVSVLGPGPRATTIEGVVDGLQLDPGWTIEKTIVEETGYVGGCSRFLDIGNRCPSVTRYYLADARFGDAVTAAHRMVEGAGAVIDWEADPGCLTATNSSGACFLYGNVGDIRLAVNVYRPGEGDDGLGIARPDRVLVRLIGNVERPRPAARPSGSP